MKIIKAVHKAITDNGILSPEALVNFCGICYKSAVEIFNGDSKAKLADIQTVLNSLGLMLKNEVTHG